MPSLCRLLVLFPLVCAPPRFGVLPAAVAAGKPVTERGFSVLGRPVDAETFRANVAPLHKHFARGYRAGGLEVSHTAPLVKSFPEALAEWLFGSLDDDGDGALGAEEVPAAAMQLLDGDGAGGVASKEMTMAKARAMFDALDADDDGFIDESEMPVDAIRGIEGSDNNASNDDGMLSADEFHAYWQASISDTMETAGDGAAASQGSAASVAMEM